MNIAIQEHICFLQDALLLSQIDHMLDKYRNA
jgi:hypothetical protein